jgi:hypothetical protein
MYAHAISKCPIDVSSLADVAESMPLVIFWVSCVSLCSRIVTAVHMLLSEEQFV